MRLWVGCVPSGVELAAGVLSSFLVIMPLMSRIFMRLGAG